MPGNTVTSAPLRTLRLDRDASAQCQPRFFRARGRPALAVRRLTPSARKQVAELRPDPIRSDTSRHEVAPALGGEPSTAGHPAEAERHSSDPASQAGLAPKRETVGLCGLRTVRFRETSGLNKRRTTCLRGSCTFIQNESTGLLTHPMLGPRAASPESPRRDPRSAAPKVPSVDELPSERSKLSLDSVLRVGRFHKLSPAGGTARRRFQTTP